MNCKSSGIDLAAIEAHLLIIRPGKCLEICAITILAEEQRGGSAPSPGSYTYDRVVLCLRIYGVQEYMISSRVLFVCCLSSVDSFSSQDLYRMCPPP